MYIFKENLHISLRKVDARSRWQELSPWLTPNLHQLWRLRAALTCPVNRLNNKSRTQKHFNCSIQYRDS